LNNDDAPGTLFIVSAPSGAGKTSLVRALLEDVGQLTVSVSHTTRPMRPGEADGTDYHFVGKRRFERMVADGAFLEHAQVFDNRYGTSKLAVERDLQRGMDVLLEIDWQGARQVRRMMPDCVGIFIVPPSRGVLEERLRGRGQDAQEVIARRMRDAVGEMGHYHEYDYIVINDVFETARTELASIVRTMRLRRATQERRHSGLFAALLASAD
jgi:guanylate kinase